LKDGALAYARGYGYAVLDPAIPIDSSKLFEIASVSKHFTAAAIVLLAQQGKLKFTDDVRQYVPELPSYGTPITIDHLLWHTSGLRDYVFLNYLAGHVYSTVTTQQQVLDLIVRQRKLDFPTGTRYRYSNTGYFLLGLIAERVSGKSLNDFTRETVFTPLGMPNATLRDRHDKPIPNQALGYAPDGAGGYTLFMSNWEQVGPTGVQISIDELQQWDENFYEPRVGGPQFVDEMLHRGKLDNGKPLIYARGLQVDRYRGLRRVRHGGDSYGYHANLVRFPDQHTTIALLCNSEGIDQYTLSRKVIDIVLEDAFTQPPDEDGSSGGPLPAERFAGHYFASSLKEVVDVTVENGEPVLKLLYLSLPLVAKGPTTFSLQGFANSVVEFKVPEGGQAQSVNIVVEKEDVDDTPIVGKRFTPVIAASLESYAGSFQSPELGVSWKLSLDNGRLTLENTPALAALPVAGPLSGGTEPDSFYSTAGFLQFTRDASGQVNGFNLSINGQLDYRFDREHL
jgi:CubicO group peptidase (beta-lactamase class C family)